MQTSKCAACGRPIEIIVDLNGKKQKLDPRTPVYDVTGETCSPTVGYMIPHRFVCPIEKKLQKIPGKIVIDKSIPGLVGPPRIKKKNRER